MDPLTKGAVILLIVFMTTFYLIPVLWAWELCFPEHGPLWTYLWKKLKNKL